MNILWCKLIHIYMTHNFSVIISDKKRVSTQWHWLGNLQRSKKGWINPNNKSQVFEWL